MNGYVVVSIVLFILLAAVLLQLQRTQSAVKRLDEMLTNAMEGNPEKLISDESTPLEKHLWEYLDRNRQSIRTAQAQKDQMGALVSDMIHQVQPSVAQLQQYAHTLSKQPLTFQEKECVRGMEGQANKLQALMESMDKIIRLETGEITLRTQVDELAPMVARAAAQYAPKAWDKEVSLTVGQGGGQAVFDAKWTEEALCSLLENAVKYTSPGGSVRVEIQNDEFFSAIQVSDTGPGILESDQEKIFNRFYRASGASQQEGAGIGLYLTDQIVQRQGGHMKVESVLGKGSTFWMYLPREKKKKPAKYKKPI
jgi:signal transduction histidine kinase